MRATRSSLGFDTLWYVFCVLNPRTCPLSLEKLPLLVVWCIHVAAAPAKPNVVSPATLRGDGLSPQILANSPRVPPREDHPRREHLEHPE